MPQSRAAPGRTCRPRCRQPAGRRGCCKPLLSARGWGGAAYMAHVQRQRAPSRVRQVIDRLTSVSSACPRWRPDWIEVAVRIGSPRPPGRDDFSGKHPQDGRKPQRAPGDHPGVGALRVSLPVGKEVPLQIAGFLTEAAAVMCARLLCPRGQRPRGGRQRRKTSQANRQPPVWSASG